MATIIQTVPASTGTGTITATLTSSLLNSRLIVYIGTGALADTVSTVTDNNGNTYNKDVNLAAGTSDIEIWSALSKGGVTTITITFASTSQHGAYVREYAGLRPLVSQVLYDDVTKSGSGSTTAQTTGNSSTTKDPTNLVVVASNYATTGQTLAAGSGFGNFVSQTVGATFILGIEDKVTTAVGAQAGTMTSGSAVAYAIALVAYPLSNMQTNNYEFVKVGDGMSVSEKIR